MKTLIKIPKIEKGIPISTWSRKLSCYPFAMMQIRDSFLCDSTIKGFAQAQRVRSAASQYGRRNKKKFTVRKTDQGYRVWRIH